MSFIGKLFGVGVAAPPDAVKLDGTSEAALGRSLSALPAGVRGWITFAEARTSLSRPRMQNSPLAKWTMTAEKPSSLAARHQPVISFMPVEARVYFVKKHS